MDTRCCPQSTWTFATWNLGYDKDFFNMAIRNRRYDFKRYSAKDLSFTRDLVARKAFKNLKTRPSIFCLQKVGTDSSRIKTWLDEGYELETDGHDSGVAWDSIVWRKVGSYHPLRNKEFTLIDLQDLNTKKIVRVASKRISDFDDPKKGEEELVNFLRFVHAPQEIKPDALVLGIDVQMLDKSYSKRVEIIESQGFKRDGEDKLFTCFKQKVGEYGSFIQTDYLFVKSVSDLDVSISPYPEKLFAVIEYSLLTPSDHLPVVKNFTLSKPQEFFGFYDEVSKVLGLIHQCFDNRKYPSNMEEIEVEIEELKRKIKTQLGEKLIDKLESEYSKACLNFLKSLTDQIDSLIRNLPENYELLITSFNHLKKFRRELTDSTLKEYANTQYVSLKKAYKNSEMCRERFY